MIQMDVIPTNARVYFLGIGNSRVEKRSILIQMHVIQMVLHGT